MKKHLQNSRDVSRLARGARVMLQGCSGGTEGAQGARRGLGGHGGGSAGAAQLCPPPAVLPSCPQRRTEVPQPWVLAPTLAAPQGQGLPRPRETHPRE